MPLKVEKAIIKTLCYADVFDYPLKLEEIWKRLVEFRIQNSEFRNKLKDPKLELIKGKDGYYFLKGRKEIVDLRKKREKFSREKLKIADKVLNIFKIIPSVKLVGITGALAVNNVEEDDDIDLFIITSRNSLWTTRFLVTLFAELMRRRRHPGDVDVSNKICLNMFADEDHLAVPKEEQDLFSAHEVVQMKLLWERDNTYYRLLRANDWVRKYLPNVYEGLLLGEGDKDTSEVAKQRLRLLGWWRNQKGIFSIFENFLGKFQLWYMRNRRTTEVIQDGIIRFHPQDARIRVMKEYKNRVTIYNNT